LNNIIENFNNNFSDILNIHINCININYLLEIITNSQYNIITKNIFDKIKILEYNIEEINNILYSDCFLCNKKQFRLNLNKYTFESYILYLKKIKICKIKKDNMFYNNYNINNKNYAYLCYICNNKITNHTFFNSFFFDNLNKETNNLSEKQINILNKIKKLC